MTINIKENTYVSIKTTEAVLKYSLPNSDRYDENLKAIMTALADEQSLASALDFLDLHTIEERMRGKKHIFIYFNGKVAGLCKLHLIKEDSDADGNLNHVILTVEVLEEVTRERQEKDKALAEQFAIIDTLARNFKNVFIANLNSGTARIVRLADDYDVRAVLAVMEDEFPFDSVIKQWIQENVHPDDKGKVAEAFKLENLRRVFSERDEYNGTYRSTEGGKLHHYQFDFRKADDRGNIVAGFQVIDAIVEEHEQQAKREKELEDARLRGEREHAEVVNSLSTIYSTIFRADIDTRQYDILTSVPLMGEVAKTSGNFDDVKDQILDSFMVPEFRDSMREFLDFNTLAERLKSVNTITTEYKAPTGQWMQSRFIAKRRDENGTAKEILYVAHDITEEKLHDLKQQEALAQALAAAQQANKAKTTFLNSMSHDIRTPMNGKKRDI